MRTAISFVLLTLAPLALSDTHPSSCFGKPKNPNSKNPLCGGSGVLNKPKILFETGGIEQDDCLGRCGNLGFRCQSVAYNTTNGGCSLYRKLLQDMEFTVAAQKNDRRYYNKKQCLNETCGPYCGFARVREPETAPAGNIVLDTSFENNPSGWTYLQSSRHSDECDGGFYPFDGIGFGELLYTKGSGPQYIEQEVPFKFNKTYNFRYRYRVGTYEVERNKQFCTLIPMFSGQFQGIPFDPIIMDVSGDLYTLVEQSVTIQKKKSPQVLKFQLKCSKHVTSAEVALDTVSMAEA